MLAVGLCCAKENCSFTGVDEERYKSSFIKIYNFHCTGAKGYDYVEHAVWVQYDRNLHSVLSSYYIDGTERKVECFEYTENEKKNGDVDNIGLYSITLYDEFNIVTKQNYYTTSFDYMEKTLLNKWNRLKKTINK
jgi:hypothetical protein